MILPSKSNQIVCLFQKIVQKFKKNRTLQESGLHFDIVDSNVFGLRVDDGSLCATWNWSQKRWRKRFLTKILTFLNEIFELEKTNHAKSSSEFLELEFVNLKFQFCDRPCKANHATNENAKVNKRWGFFMLSGVLFGMRWTYCYLRWVRTLPPLIGFLNPRKCLDVSGFLNCFLKCELRVLTMEERMCARSSNCESVIGETRLPRLFYNFIYCMS